MVVVNPTDYGSHPIRGIEFQRICPNEKGHRVGRGFFNDAVMAAYLAILQSNMPSQLKVASPWATLQLTLRRFDEVMRALRYQNTRRQYGVVDILHLQYTRCMWRGQTLHNCRNQYRGEDVHVL